MEAETFLRDEEIIELYFDRNETAITETDRKYGKLLYTIAFQILKSSENAKECCNDAYLGIWNAIPPARPSMFRAFVAQIGRRIAINRYKQMMCQRRVPSEMTVSMEDLTRTLQGVPAAEDAYCVKEVAKVIGDYVRSLSRKRQYIFMERYYMAGSVEDIAKVLRISESAVYKELAKIKMGLRAHLERNDIYI